MENPGQFSAEINSYADLIARLMESYGEYYGDQGPPGNTIRGQAEFSEKVLAALNAWEIDNV